MGTKTTMSEDAPRGTSDNRDRLSMSSRVVLCLATCTLLMMVFAPSATTMPLQYASGILPLLLEMTLIGIAMLPKTRAGDAAKAAAITFLVPYAIDSLVIFSSMLVAFVPTAIQQVSSSSVAIFDLTSPLRDGLVVLAKFVLLLAIVCLSGLLSRLGIGSALRTYGRRQGIKMLLLSSGRHLLALVYLISMYQYWQAMLYETAQGVWTPADIGLHASLYSASLLAMLLWMVAKALDTTSPSSLHAGGTDSERKTTSPHEESLVE